MDNVKHTTISLKQGEFVKIKGYLVGSETVSQFCQKAVLEKIRRMDIRNKQAQLQLLRNNINLMRPIIKEILKEEGI